MDSQLTVGLYLVAGILFIRSLGGLSTQETARRGNHYGIVGMVLAIVATAVAASQSSGAAGLGVMAATLAVGGLIGGVLAQRVAMTSMPELVAILHSFVGLAAVLVGFSAYFAPQTVPMTSAAHAIHAIEIFLGVWVGALTFTGSIVAFLKRERKSEMGSETTAMVPLGWG